ncbi:N-acetylmannosamine-6-phosphate 2-epimerase [Aeromonas enteropelogenes]|uniref:N-acetylmannosamine-6-phosphate 2-epimerase n=1 Tax=Aeromonas enteropelogenes TaxID=29489 RepID=UPI000B2A2835|nr:N-acetylmannosamine-6-phosphate 2-epimerase [Aeromonas enteropelogenes]UBH56378.1 N-acetylmannosamine-6-phosphate 2-epimerase [Aeromonas enteropelogenes]
MLNQIKGKLIVSCQALEDEPLHSDFIMGKMALAAARGGASAIRANSVVDIKAIKQEVSLPVIGILKRDYPGSDVYITATMREVDELMAASPEMIALDATFHQRPDGLTLAQMMGTIRARYPQLMLMADIATVEEALHAEQLGFDCIGTTLHGYTAETQSHKLYDDDFAFLRSVLEAVNKPVIAEGNVNTPQMAARCLQLGAHAVVVGGAITRPQQITERFIEAMGLSS